MTYAKLLSFHPWLLRRISGACTQGTGWGDRNMPRLGQAWWPMASTAAFFVMMCVLITAPISARAQTAGSTDMIKPPAVAITAPAVSDVGLTDSVVLFPTVGQLSGDGLHWLFEVRVWVAIPARSRVRKAAAEALLGKLYGVTVSAEARPLFEQRIDLLFADNKGRRRIIIEVAGQRYALAPTGSNGHSVSALKIPVTEAEGAQVRGARPRRLQATVVLPARDVRLLTADFHLVSGTGLSIISDIDDTVKVSHVTDRAMLMRKTFVEPYAAVVGMKALIERLGQGHAPVHYVSSTPWHFGEFLMTFMSASGLALHELQLKHVRIKDGTVFDLFKSPTATKPPQILAILKRFPDRQFILIGDNGEADPEVYGQIARAHRQQIARILIRNCCPEKASDTRFQRAFDGLPASLWQVFTDPSLIK